ncbi:MAG: porin family protein [Bacteroidia bacterium]|nr:porin family protein [Bacteroidia bacterium]
MKKIFTIVIVLVLCSLISQAQIRYGVQAGLNLSTMTLKQSGLTFDAKMLMGPEVGVFAVIPVTNEIDIQPGIAYSFRGSKYSFMGTDSKISPVYINIPINVLYNFNIAKNKAFVFVGLYLADGISGKVDNGSGNGSQDIKFGSDTSKTMKAFDYGLNFGVGYEFSNFQVALQYNLGLANLAPVTTDNAEMKARNINISLAYLFGNNTNTKSRSKGKRK